LSLGAKFQPRQQRVYQDTYGVIFLGTPHRGSPWAPWAKIATNLAKVALQSPSTALLDALQVDSAVLQIIADEFSKMIREDVKVHSFREEKGMSGLYGLDAKVCYTYYIQTQVVNHFLIHYYTLDCRRLFLNHWRCCRRSRRD
jgi:hypothetical protein